jgi:hypothetical protein
LLLETHKMVPKLEQKGCDALLQLTLWSTWIELKCVKPSRWKLSPALLSKVFMLHMIFFRWLQMKFWYSVFSPCYVFIVL